jgi:hypothetical protein
MRDTRKVEELSIKELVFNENHPRIVRDDLNALRISMGLEPVPPRAAENGPIARVYCDPNLTVDQKIQRIVALYESGVRDEAEWQIVAEDLMSAMHGAEGAEDGPERPA